MQISHVLKKCLAVGIILLFIGVAVATSINSSVVKAHVVPEKKNVFTIIVLEYKPDGTMGNSFVKLTQAQERRFRAELDSNKDIDSQLSVYKKYHLISQNITSEQLRTGMEEKAKRIGLTQLISKYYQHNNQKEPLLFNYDLMCHVIFSGTGIQFPLGLSLIIGGINGFLGTHIPSFDFSNRLIINHGTLITKGGLLAGINISGWSFPFVVKLMGFVGFTALIINYFVLFGLEVNGFAVYVRA
jgi:hypothetical protein